MMNWVVADWLSTDNDRRCCCFLWELFVACSCCSLAVTRRSRSCQRSISIFCCSVWTSTLIILLYTTWNGVEETLLGSRRCFEREKIKTIFTSHPQPSSSLCFVFCTCERRNLMPMRRETRKIYYSLVLWEIYCRCHFPVDMQLKLIYFFLVSSTHRFMPKKESSACRVVGGMR